MGRQLVQLSEDNRNKGDVFVALGNLANCTRCETLFVKAVRDICPKCHQDVENEYDKVVKFLRKRENRGSNIHQVKEGTGVSIRQITKFIKEGRISIDGNPNLGYPCENCGNLVRSNNLCDDCAKGLKHEIEQQLDLDKRLAEDQRKRLADAAYRRKANHDD